MILLSVAIVKLIGNIYFWPKIILFSALKCRTNLKNRYRDRFECRIYRNWFLLNKSNMEMIQNNHLSSNKAYKWVFYVLKLKTVYFKTFICRKNKLLLITQMSSWLKITSHWSQNNFLWIIRVSKWSKISFFWVFKSQNDRKMKIKIIFF